MKDNMEFRNRLIELRKQKGWSQEELGYRLGVTRQTVSKWETGESIPEVTKLIKLGKLYNLSVDELVGGKENLDVNVNNTENKIKKKSFVKRYFRKIIISVASILLIIYLGFSAYKFCILKDINDKFNEYKNVNNCYLERKEIVTNNENGTAYILNERYWYKDNFFKIENVKTENGETTTICRYIDFNKEEMYIIYENTKKIRKKFNIEEYKELQIGILEYVFKENYYKNNIDIIKISLNIFDNIIVQGDNYLKRYYALGKKMEKVYDIDTGFIKKSEVLDNSEDIKILYNIEMQIVKDEELKIEFLDLENYEVIEQ